MLAVLFTVEFGICRIELLKMQLNVHMYFHITFN